MAGKNLFSRHGKGDLGLELALLYMDKDPAKQGAKLTSSILTMTKSKQDSEQDGGGEFFREGSW